MIWIDSDPFGFVSIFLRGVRRSPFVETLARSPRPRRSPTHSLVAGLCGLRPKSAEVTANVELLVDLLLVLKNRCEEQKVALETMAGCCTHAVTHAHFEVLRSFASLLCRVTFEGSHMG